MGFDTPATAALWFLIFAAPICLWVAWSDLRSMKIPNKAVIALVCVYLAVGIAVLPLPDYLCTRLSLSPQALGVHFWKEMSSI